MGRKMDMREFNETVAAAIDTLPEEFSGYLSDVAILVKDMADEYAQAEIGVSDGMDLLGAYFGRPVGERSVFDVVDPQFQRGIPGLFFARPSAHGSRP